jgi:hypothetical protein
MPQVEQSQRQPEPLDFQRLSTNRRRQVKKVQRERKGSDLDFRNAPGLWVRAAKIEI